MEVSQRNQMAKDYVCMHLVQARKQSITDFAIFKADKDLERILKDLIYTKANGFRGVVLTAIVGIHLNPQYNPLNSFYEANPRAIFENGIWYALSENGIPSGKSDPLNVAKNINELNESWVKGKRPETAAQAAVDFLKRLVSATEKERQGLIDYFFFHLIQFANDVASIEIIVPEDAKTVGQTINDKLIKFTLSYPESGTIPQLVIGELLLHLHQNSGYVVNGTQESVFGTNTTSDLLPKFSPDLSRVLHSL